MRRLRAGIVGTGGAAWVGHMPWLWAHEQVDFVATCALDDGASAAAKRFDVPSAYSDIAQMLERESLDFLVIATPPALHHPQTLAALERGLHVMVEKPLALSVAQCDEIIAAARAAHKHVSVSHEKRFNPGFEKIKQIVKDGLLGDLFYAVVHWSAAVRLDPDALCPPDYRSSYEWRWRNGHVGGGIIADHLPHYVDLWRWWLNSEVTSCTTELLNVRHDLIGDCSSGEHYEDFGTILLRFASGAIGFFESGNAGRGISPIMNIGSGIGEWTEYGMLYGTRGHLVFDLLPWDSPELPRIMVYSLEEKSPSYRGWFQVELPDPWRSPGGPRAPSSNEHYQFKRQLDDFVSAIQDNRPPRVTALDGKATLVAVEAAYKSAKTNQKVSIV